MCHKSDGPRKVPDDLGKVSDQYVHDVPNVHDVYSLSSSFTSQLTTLLQLQTCLFLSLISAYKPKTTTDHNPPQSP